MRGRRASYLALPCPAKGCTILQENYFFTISYYFPMGWEEYDIEDFFLLYFGG